MRDKVIILDGNNFAYANYFTHQSLRVQNGPKQGFPTGLIHGCLIGLMRLSDLFERAPIVIVWDGPGKSWRKREYPEYKAKRQRDEKIGRNILMQMAVLEGFLDAFQVPQLRLANVEADDLIGVLSRELQKDFDQIVIRSSDQDFYQLLSDRVQVYRGGEEKELMTTERLQKEFSVEPKHWCQVRAMSGDPTDNLIGLPKVGLLTATRLFAAGVRVPVNGNLSQVKVQRFSCDSLSEQDWRRVNQNYRLSRIVTRYDDPRLPQKAWQSITEFLVQQRKQEYKRDRKKMRQWSLLKELGQYELSDVKMSIGDLLALF